MWINNNLAKNTAASMKGKKKEKNKNKSQEKKIGNTRQHGNDLIHGRFYPKKRLSFDVFSVPLTRP